MPKKKEDKIDQILNKLDDMEKRFDAQDKRFDAHDNKLKEHDKQFKLVIDKLFDHDDQFEKMNTKIDLKFDQVLTGLDKVTSELEKAREDRQLAQSKDKKQDERLDKLELVVGINRA